MKQESKKMAVITGCDSGIGKSLCRIYLEKGFYVVAAYLESPPFEDTPNCLFLQLDLRKEESIARFAEAVREKISAGFVLSRLVQNAGMVMAAPIENMPLEILREVFEVNFFGVYSLTQKLIPALVCSKGRILLIGSMAGKIGLPFFSPYVSSKFALEGFTESLRRELLPLGIKTVLFEPGAIATPIWNRSWENIKQKLLPLVGDRYKKSFENGAEKFVSGGNNGLPADKAAEKIFRIGEKTNPKSRYIISGNILLDKLELLIPTGLMDKLIAGMFGV